MSENCKEELDWKKFVDENHDCPEAIYKMAETEWQKQVALEFLSNQEDRNLMKQKLATMEKLTYGTFGITALAVVSYFVQTFLFPLL